MFVNLECVVVSWDILLFHQEITRKFMMMMMHHACFAIPDEFVNVFCCRGSLESCVH